MFCNTKDLHEPDLPMTLVSVFAYRKPSMTATILVAFKRSIRSKVISFRGSGIGEGASAVAAVEVAVTEASCSPIAGTDAVVCTELIATLAMDALAIDTVHRVTVENPGAAACVSQQPIDLMVVAPPEIAAIDTATVCTGGGTITITGVNLTGVTGRLIDPDTQGVVDAVNTVVSEDGTSASITFGSGVTPDTYQLQVAGTHGCADIASQQVTAAIGPVAFFMEPPVAYNGVALRGTLYASGVGSAPASVTLVPAGGGTAGDEEPLSSVVWPSAGSSNKIGATIPEGLDEGAYDVMVDFPGSCDSVLPNGLVVEAGGQTAVVPLDAVRATLRVGAGDIAKTAEGVSIVLGDKVVPFAPLAGSLNRQSHSSVDRSWSAVVNTREAASKARWNWVIATISSSSTATGSTRRRRSI